MPTAIVNHKGKPWLLVHWPEGTFPPCLWCGNPVDRPSADGPLVCPLCDMGAGSGPDGRATWMEVSARRRRCREAVFNIRVAQTESDKARIREVGGDPEPTSAPDLAVEQEWVRELVLRREQEWARMLEDHAGFLAGLGSKPSTLP